ncbi:MAG: hypothetical protein H7296_13885 [Bacteroidia bacterium]|nr:hypothetical protein [Bacteroidia bacterium]
MPFLKHIRLFIILITSMYCHGLVKPVMPLIKDVVAHVFFEMEHLSTVHHEHGHNHMHAELLNEAEEEENHHATSINFETFTDHLWFIEPVEILQPFKQSTKHFTAYLKHIPAINSDTPFVPPKI